jgi:hypothetical protein
MNTKLKNEISFQIKLDLKSWQVQKLFYSLINDDTQKLDDLKTALDKIVSSTRHLVSQSFKLPFEITDLKESLQDDIRDEFLESSQGIFYSQTMDYNVGLIFLVPTNYIPNLSYVAELYRFPVSRSTTNIGTFLMDTPLQDNLHSMIERLVAHVEGFSTWQYVEDEIGVSEFIDFDEKEIYDNIDIRHKARSKANDEIVCKINLND